MKNAIYGLFIGFSIVALSVFALYNARVSEAGRNGNGERVWICHVPQGAEWNRESHYLPLPAAESHLREHDLDYRGRCEPLSQCEELKSNLGDEEWRSEFQRRCVQDRRTFAQCRARLERCEINVCRIFPQILECQPKPTPDPTPTPTPEPTPVVRELTEASAPQCPNGVPAIVPANPHVVRNGSEAVVNAHIPEGDRVNIYFRENSEEGWTHAERDIPVQGQYLSHTIHELNPALGYTFGIQAANGCAGGEILAVIVDPPAYGQLFPFSYWEWLR